MRRVSLDRRLEWLENGHEDDMQFNVALMRHVRDMSMAQYFGGRDRIKLLPDLANLFGLPEKALGVMTYGKVVGRIHEMMGSDDTRPIAQDAVWLLTLPYILEAKKREMEKNEANKS